MTIGDRLQAELRELESRESHDVEADYRRFLEAYGQWTQDPRYRAKARAEGPLLGQAAYFVGVHLAAAGKTEQAREWLQIAAHYDVGDAALRLAHLYELESMRDVDPTQQTPSSESLDIENLALANYWYARAREAGSMRGKDQPAVDLELGDCCSAQSESMARVEALRIVAKAKADAASLLRQAKAEVQSILDQARSEYDRIAIQRQAIAERLLLVRAALHGHAAAGSRPPTREEPRGKLFKRRVGRKEEAAPYVIPDELEQQLTLCSKVLHEILVHDEPVSRPMIAGVIQELAERASDPCLAENLHADL
jgi:hypothetical protein